MKIVLATLNSKYIHAALAIRYLKSYSKGIADIELMEFTINQNIDYIAGEIYKKNPDIIGFSTYIWNRDETLKICEIIKLVRPETKIILGGPEVSFDGLDLMNNCWYVDFIIYGEGEITFKELLNSIISEREDYSTIEGIIYRKGDSIIENPPRELINNLDIIPSPYKIIRDEFRDKIVYLESSRGCPFNCQFCLSSTIKGVRFFSLDRVKEDLERLIEAEVRQVKFVDRTFNANKEYAMEIMDFIMKKNPHNINFHFEVTAHLLDDDMLKFLKRAKEGLFQFEIGVQSTNERTLNAIGRITNLSRLKKVTKQIKSYKNIHQHLDLIAGLPYEDYDSFKKSFNDVYELKPEKIQLGFLKLLKGSGLRKDRMQYGFKFLDSPPYEVLETNYIKYEEMLKLKGIEDLVEKYYNEKYFEHSIEYIINNYYKSPFDFYEDYLKYWEENGFHKILHSRNRLYEILIQFCRHKKFSDLNIIIEIIKYDYIINNKNFNIPKFFPREEVEVIQKNKHKILKDKNILQEFLPKYINSPTKRIINKIHIEKFRIDIICLINNGYHVTTNIFKNSYILFEYKEGVINRCFSYDISDYIKRSDLK
ncbi:radical SAM superfamily enzyme YgiQ (UPF0313 family) [Keratinibaculum paraultunense]|uniref:Radical SAM superfamily enzyme YgiQ (UPF0313 family) n=1 Tax=Keratinibaculum paraultunense TaxID=1278232 RepID=A0A4R3KMA3_9FIRM|nr:B12-binding domain-containing radical SAM protein [Keratinibaculum paraultunense]QQY80381.1 B12-binding domain-containing radical SAM protein [Keratinibaculum paraultunense]TCS85384.1 radical SAM superfamily enzyme YgiQ (UPF0313 family) [Keratinibaculum paraultunense]